MNKAPALFTALALLGFCLTSPLKANDASAPTTPVTPLAKQVEAEASAEPKLTVARNGSEVVVAWKLPPGEYRSIQITRHIQADPRGRSGVGGSLPPSRTSYLDTVPDKAATYWYWIKITRTDLSVFNVGPAVSAPAEVWTP